MNNLRRRCLVEEGGPEVHLYYTIDSIPSASFPEYSVNIVNSRTAGGSKSFSNTLSMSINLLDHYQDAHGVEKTRTKSISLSASLSMKGTVAYKSSTDTATLTITFTEKEVTVDGIQVTLNGTTITQGFTGSSALSYGKNITMSAKVDSSTKSKRTSEQMQVNQTSVGKIGVHFL